MNPPNIFFFIFCMVSCEDLSAIHINKKKEFVVSTCRNSLVAVALMRDMENLGPNLHSLNLEQGLDLNVPTMTALNTRL